MSEVSDQGSPPGHGAAAHAGASAGAQIRRARESAGVHIASLAVALKVPVRRLEALEADRYDLLTDAVFVRALASSVCRSLKIDPAHILPLLPRTQAQPLSVEGRINEPFRSSQEAAAGRRPVSQPAVLAGVVLVLAALTVYFWPDFMAWYSPDTAAPASVGADLPASGMAPAPPSTVIEAVPSATLPPSPAPAAPAMPVMPVPVLPAQR
jgi:cytoskeleton protein RodZ